MYGVWVAVMVSCIGGFMCMGLGLRYGELYCRFYVYGVWRGLCVWGLMCMGLGEVLCV